jgi:flagellar basal-body rod protein FlgB
MSLFSNTIHLLENSINYSATKQKVISENIANVDTPNYKAKEVLPFKKVLENEKNKTISQSITNEKHITFNSKAGTNFNSLSIIDKKVQFNESGNGVDMDQEMVKLAENQIYYNALVDRISGKFQTLRKVIKGGQ